MNNAYYRLFNFFGAPLTRYRWRNRDFGDLQDNGLVAMIQGLMQGEFKGAVLQGLQISGVTGLNFTVASGFAVGPSGDLLYLSVPVTGSFSSPTGAAGGRGVCVIQPYVSTPASGIITPPTTPLTTAPLFFDHYARVTTYQNAGGSTPAIGANDIVLFGVRLAQSATSIAASSCIYSGRDIPGQRNADVDGALLQNSIQWDDRCRPYASGVTLGVKPSQTQRLGALYPGFTGAVKASIFPKAAGAYNGDVGDTFLNFTTGAITGADTTSSDFTPTIPASNSFIWALVSLTSTDTLAVSYGTAGTYLQCLTKFKSQTTSGAGGIPTSSNFKVALVLLGSSDGSSITEIDCFDARGLGTNVVAASAGVTITPVVGPTTYNMNGTEQHLEIDAAAGDVTVVLPPRAANEGSNYPMDRIDGATGTVTVTRQGSDVFAEPNATTGYPIDNYQSQDIFAGTGAWKVRG